MKRAVVGAARRVPGVAQVIDEISVTGINPVRSPMTSRYHFSAEWFATSKNVGKGLSAENRMPGSHNSCGSLSGETVRIFDASISMAQRAMTVLTAAASHGYNLIMRPQLPLNQEGRILAALGRIHGPLPRVALKWLMCYHDYLAANLELPFEARCLEDRGSLCPWTTTVKIVGLLPPHIKPVTILGFSAKPFAERNCLRCHWSNWKWKMTSRTRS